MDEELTVVDDQQELVANNTSTTDIDFVEPESVSVNETLTMEIEKSISLFSEGESYIKFSSNKGAVIFLGMTGSGKSTLIQFIAGENDKLIATEVAGQMIIVDQQDKIGASSINSKTLYPDLIEDPITGTPFYDCPGFGDTRSPSFDIAAGYFIKKVFDKTENVKIVLTVAHFAVRLGVDRARFMDLAKHIVNLFPDINVFQSGLSLIVTKVDNTFKFKRGVPYLVSDEKEIDNTAEFLKAVKSSLSENIKSLITSTDDRTFFVNTIKLIDILLTKENNVYKRMGIFRRPLEEGPLSENDLLQESKRHILNVIHNNIDFITKQENDVDYTISSKSKLYISGIIQSINNKIKIIINEILEVIVQSYVQRCKNHTSDLADFENELEQNLSVANNLLFLSQNNIIKAGDLFNKLQILVNKVVNNIKAEKELQTMLQLIKFADSFTKFIDGNVQNSYEIWFPSLVKIKEFIHQLHNSYKFLLLLKDDLSDIKYQNYRERYNVKDISHWGQDGSEQGIHISDENIQMFFEQFYDRYKNADVSYNYILDLNKSLSEEWLIDLNRILSHTLKHTMTSLMNDSVELAVSGEFIKLSEVIKLLNGRKVKKIKIFAHSFVIIDTDIIKIGEEVIITIIAPKWEIVGDVRFITLDGKPGASHSPLQATFKANPPGRKGDDGKAGNPGGNSGSFIGIGDEIINGQNLFISLKGGKGGPGQHGGRGSTGAKGPTVHFDPDPRCHVYKSLWQVDNPPRSQCVNAQIGHHMAGGLVRIDRDAIDCKIFGTDGGKGGDGGPGGAGGIGGYPGSLELYFPTNNTKVNVQTGNGKNGEDGNGGLGGLTGPKYVRKARKKERQKKIKILGWKRNAYKDTCWEVRGQELEPDKRISGKNGAKGSNSKGMRTPNASLSNKIFPIINEFKTSAMLSLQNRVEIKSILKFLQFIEQNNSIQIKYEAIDFVSELHSLEKILRQTNNFRTIGRFYVSLMRKVSLYANTKPEIKENYEVIKILNTVFSAVLSRTYNEGLNKERLLIIDLTNFIADLEDKISSIKDRKLYVVVNDAVKKYKDQIEEKLTEASNVVEIKVKDEVNRIESDLVRTIDVLYRETLSLKEQAVDKKQDLQRVEKELAKKSRLQKFLAFGKSVCTTLGIFNPIVSGLSGVLDLARTIFVNTQYNNVSSIIQNFEQAREQINALPGLFKQANDEDVPVHAYDKIALGVESIAKTIEESHNTDDSIAARKSIQEMDEIIKALDSYKNSIYEDLNPFLINILNQINSLENVLKDKSHVEIDVKEWEIQKFIRTVQQHVKRFNSVFNTEDIFQQFITEINELANLLIKIFDRIQNYQEQKQLADYLATINSPQFSSIKLSDPIKEEAINNLELIVESNLLASQYQRIVNAVKQHVFPFAGSYLQQELILFVPSINTTMDQLNYDTIQKIKHVSQKLQENKSTINQGRDKNIHIGEFDSKYKSSYPFYIWINGKYKNQISSLLSGSEVLLYSDIRSSGKKNAIKFNYLELNIKSSNRSTQNELNEILKGYDAKLTHLGNSYYKCDTKYFVINSDSQTLSYSFERNNVGEPIRQNQVYRKIVNGDVLLSPYTLWNLQLINVSTVGYFELKKYSDQVNLELVGKGQYISPNNEICESDLDQFYDAYDDTDENIPYDSVKSRQVREASSNIVDSVPLTSAGVGVTSPINNAINYIANISGLLYKYVTTPFQEMNNFVSNLKDIFNSSAGSSETFSSNLFSTTNLQFNFHETLLLVDYLVRHVTKIRPYCTFTPCMSHLEAQGLALNIVGHLEDVLVDFCSKMNISSELIQLDTLKLQKKLISGIINRQKDFEKNLTTSILNFIKIDPSVKYNTSFVEQLNLKLSDVNIMQIFSDFDDPGILDINLLHERGDKYYTSCHVTSQNNIITNVQVSKQLTNNVS